MNSNSKKFNETLFQDKEDFERHLNTEDITDADYIQKKSRDCEKENLGEYHDLNIQSGALCTWELII